MADREKIFTFVANDSEGLPSNRKQTRRACEHCRKRKRRCAHGPRLAPRVPEKQSPRNTTVNDTSSPAAGQEVSVTTSSGNTNDTAGATQSNSQLQGPGARVDGESWFVGNMDPEGAFLIAASPDSNSGAIRRHDLGVWLPARNAYSQLAVKKPRSSFISCPDPLISSVFLPYLEDQCLSVLPAPHDMEGLLRIYMENIHPIFPVLDLDSYQAMPSKSPERILLSQTVCIAASIDRNSKQYLNLLTVAISHADFSRSLLDAMNTSIALGLVRDKLVLIQSLSLTSLFTQFSGDRQESAELLSRAICHAHTIGLHHRCHSSMPSQKEQISTRLFCCLYALDILNSACLGRPVQFHRQDFGRDLLLSIAAQEGCFQLFLRTILLMERAIEIYRPAENGVWKGVFPSFEDLLQEVGTSTGIPMHLTGKALHLRTLFIDLGI
ncbi:hypothetical protein N7526_000323 [Penicillium atrosanguineum]|nr:hypothetical protein N7526_000323 [Penicillium atrosanguineum]